MNGTIGQMLTLTADIAEALLTIKDTDSGITPELIDKIEQLHRLAHLPVETANDVEETPLPSAQPTMDEIPCEPIAQPAPQADPETETTQDTEEEVAQPSPLLPEATTAATTEAETTEAEISGTETTEAEISGTETTETETTEYIQATPSLTPATLREAMSINDLFLFRRTLFGGSAAAFNNALSEIATFRHISEVRNFMRDTLRINLKAPEAKDFLNVMAPFFSEF